MPATNENETNQTAAKVCRLRARVVYEWEYEADLAHDEAYTGLTPEQAAACDAAFMSQYPARHLEGEPTLTVEVVGDNGRDTSSDADDMRPHTTTDIDRGSDHA